MKKTAILLAVLLVAVAANSQNVTEEQALKKAQQFMKGKKLKPAPRMNLARNMDNIKTNDAFYAFNAEEGGFVIVSGDDRTEEILGYSDSGRIDFDNMPKNMQAWLEGYAEQINSLGSSQTMLRPERSAKPAVNPLIETQWSQRDPYNLMCPEIDGQHCVTGCVATAMAQVLYYYRYPQEETFEFPAYYSSPNWEIPSLPPTTFEWDDMLTHYDKNYSQEAADAVAKLMRYCGQAVQMEYGLQESGSGVGKEIMHCYFGFSNSAEDVHRRYYSTVEWEDMMYQEVAEGRPVLYRGLSSVSGHEFICDGYDGTGLFHINWGWGGSCDGYFLLSVLDYSGNDIASIGYSGEQRAIIHLRPRVNGETYPGPPVLYCQVASFVERDISIRNSKEEDFEVVFSSQVYAENWSDLYEGLLALVLYKDDVVLDTIPCQEIPELRDGDIRYWKFSFGANLDDGAYRLLFICDKDGNGEWKIPNGVIHRKAIIQNESFLYMSFFGDHAERKLGEEIFQIELLSCDDLFVNKRSLVALNVTNQGETFEKELSVWINNEKVSRGSAWVDSGQTGKLLLSFTPTVMGEQTFEIANTQKTTVYYSDRVYIYPSDSIYINPCYVHRGESKKVEVNLASIDCQVEEYQFKLTLPDGMTLTAEEEIEEQGAALSHNQDGSWSFTGRNQSTGNAILSITIKMDDDIAFGSHPVIIDDVCCKTNGGNTIKFLPTSTNLYVGKVPSFIRLDRAGTLPDVISAEDKYSVDKLKITGEINGTDLRLIRDMLGNNYLGEQTNGILRELDLSGARIVKGGEKYLDTDCIKGREVTGFDSFHFNVEENDVLPAYIFAFLDLESVKLPKSLKIIADKAFSNCWSLQEIVIPHGVTEIGYDAFAECWSLASVTIPNSVTSIEYHAFAYSNLSKVISKIENPFAIGDGTFPNTTFSNATLYVPEGTIDKYRAANGWKNFLSIKEFEVEPTGDANGDDTVDIADVAMIISKIQEENPSGFNIKAADMNGDGRIDHVDLTTVVNLILNQGDSF